MIAINPEGGKESRAAAIAPMIEAGNVLLPMPDEQPWVEDTLLEFCTFPAAKHDDRVDAASQALNWLQSKRAILDAGFCAAVMALNKELTRSAMNGGDGSQMDRLPSEYPEGGSLRHIRWTH
jgi:hypothetical protein